MVTRYTKRIVIPLEPITVILSDGPASARTLCKRCGHYSVKHMIAACIVLEEAKLIKARTSRGEAHYRKGSILYEIINEGSKRAATYPQPDRTTSARTVPPTSENI